MKLTYEQIAELAPEWATHYGISKKYKSIIFESESLFTILKLDSGKFTGTWSQLSEGINENSKPIPRKTKPFSITQHEWSDTVCFTEISESNLRLNCDDYLNYVDLFKADAIAIAKHFGLTAEDLK